ncbi:U4/U6 small nuclear ribonucleoprotein Prp3-like isoform X2 [Tripterygium wilfordii]|uniref:U4/U6 small nuclear ribonucleoprotein Prp3-like isoform X2 n=1 Tax=Tripterygium wilfordii TaxID=458696 RepID=A0A7J7D8E0_TRIWF|nr:U4/U6 small nuclear ribonucleoprotein Prp3-like isoform X2 [Tripterygium wilfordii]
MHTRINWADAIKEEDDKPINKCVLVWQGSVSKSSLIGCITEAATRKVFADAGVAHYWDLAVNFSDDQI